MLFFSLWNRDFVPIRKSPLCPSLRLASSLRTGPMSRSRVTKIKRSYSSLFFLSKRKIKVVLKSSEIIWASSRRREPQHLIQPRWEARAFDYYSLKIIHEFLECKRFYYTKLRLYEWRKCDFDVFERRWRWDSQIFHRNLSSFSSATKMSVSIESLWLSQIHDRECTNNAKQSKNKQQDKKGWERSCSKRRISRRMDGPSKPQERKRKGCSRWEKCIQKGKTRSNSMSKWQRSKSIRGWSGRQVISQRERKQRKNLPSSSLSTF